MRLDLAIRSMFGGLLLGSIAFGIWFLQRTNPSRLTVTRREIRYHDSDLADRRTLELSGKNANAGQADHHGDGGFM